MNELMLDVIDRDGWRKEFPLKPPIVWIGSDPANHIALSETRGRGVDARHLQLLLNSPEEGSCRLTNFSTSPIVVTSNGRDITVEPRKPTSISMDSLLRVGEYQLQMRSSGGFAAPYSPPALNGKSAASIPEWSTFQRPTVATPPTVSVPVIAEARPVVSMPPPAVTGSGAIGLGVRMSQGTLTQEQPAEAFITIGNRGDKTAVQFRLLIEGIPSECYEIPPLPLLFPNAEKSLTIQFRYPSQPLKAGAHMVRFTAIAPEAYPNEQSVIQQSIIVPTVFSHEVTLRGPL